MKLISWNVNGLRACMGKGFMDFFNAEDADFFCLQETKVQEVIVLLHHKPCPYRVHELDDAGEEEHHSGNETAEALKAQKKVSHVFIYLSQRPLQP